MNAPLKLDTGARWAAGPLIAVLSLFLVTAIPASADPNVGANGSALSPTEPASDDLKKCGEATLSVLFFDIYESTLYTPDGRFTDGVRPLRLDIRYLRDIAAAALVEQTGKEWREQGIASKRHEQWLEQLTVLWPDVSEGDVISLRINADETSTFLFNGNTLGTITDTGFGADFAGIWLAANTTRPKLREALISGQGDD